MRIIIKVAVRCKDWKGFNKTVAENIIQNSAEFINKGFEMEDLQMVLSFLQELEKQNENCLGFLDQFLGILFQEASLNTTSNEIKAIFKDFSDLCSKECSTGLKLDLYFYASLKEHLTDMIKLIGLPNYQESIVKILSKCLDLNKLEKKFMFTRFLRTSFKIEEQTNDINENINILSFFNNEMDSITSCPLKEIVVKSNDFLQVKDTLERLKDEGKHSYSS